MKRRKSFIITFLFFILFYPLNAGTVRVGYFLLPGMLNGASNEELKSGYAYDYIQELASNAGWKFEYVYGNFNELYEKLVNGEIDMLPYVSKTEARAKEIQFPQMEMGKERFYIASTKRGKLENNLSLLNGKKIGTMKGAYHNQLFLKLIKENKIECQIVEFDETHSKWDALKNGTIDYSIETSTVFQEIELYSVYEIEGYNPYYLAVTKGRKDLLSELNSACKNIHDINPNFIENLKLKYFNGIPLFKELPEEGIEWLNNNKTIVIGTYDNDEPYVIQNEDGTFSGIGCDQVSLMLKSLGIEYPVEWKLYPGREQALKALKNGEINCINPYYHNYSDSEKDGVIISQTLYSSDFSVLYKGKYSDDTLSIVATPDTRLGAQFVRDNYPNSKIIPCQNGYDCLKKLEAGEANCIIMYTDVLQSVASKYRKKHIIKNLTSNCPVCFAALPEDSGLICIINKAIPFIDEVEMSKIQNKYSIEKKSISAMTFFLTHPECLYGTLICILAVILSIFIFIWHREKVLSENRAENKIYKSIIQRFTSNYDAVLIGNLKDGSYKTLFNKHELNKYFNGKYNLETSISDFINRGVYPPDRQKMDETMIHFSEIKKKLAVGESDMLEYRSITKNGYVWYSSQMNRLSENEVLIGFKESDDEITARMVNQKLLADYEALYIVELDQNEIRPVKVSSISPIGQIKDKAIFNHTVLQFAETVSPEYKDDWIKFSDPEYIKEYMEKEDHREYIYELPGADQSLRRFTIDVLERVNNKVTTALFSFMGIDDSRAQTLLLQSKMADQKVLLDYFVESYRSAYFVDLTNDTFEILHMDPDFADVFGKKDNSRDTMLSYINKYIHPEDRPVVLQHIDKDYLKQFLKEEASVSFVMREIVNGKLKILRVVIIRGSDVEHVAVGFMDITEEMMKEKAARAKLEETLTFTNYFLDTYVSAYYVDLDTLDWQIYKRTEELEQNYPIGENYFESLTEYINKDVHPDDRENLLTVASPQNMKQLLKEHEEYSHIFRDISGGVEKIYKMQVLRGVDQNHAAYGFIDITDELKSQKKQFFGAVALSPEILSKSNVGLWAFELDKGKPPRMYVDDTMLPLIGLDHQISPEETYHAWYDHIDKDSYEIVNDAVEKMVNGEHAEVQYPWHHPDGHTIIVRCGGILNHDYIAGIRIEGTHQNVTEVLHYDEQEVERLRRTATQLQHEQLRSEVLNYMVNHTDEDPIELLKNFAERLRNLINCDQVIYRDLEETRIMVNSDQIADKWSVPIEYCKQCQHFDAHHPMYSSGYTEMENCQKGWNGIPVYHKCPIKSSLTRIVYCDGEVAGYLAIHYVQDYHKFTDIERNTLEEFTRILSMSLSRYMAKKESKEMKRYDLLHEIIHSGKWSIFVDSDNNIIKSDFSTSLKPIVDNDFTDDFNSWLDLIHPDDVNAVKEAFKASVYDKTCNTPYDITYRMRNKKGAYNWFHAAGRIVRDENGYGELFGIHINITDQIEEQINQQHQLEEALSMAQSANRAKTTFLNNMSHDIRTPMNAILGFTDIAKKNIGNTQKITDSLEKVSSAGEHLLSLINDVLDMSRIESGTVEIVPVESNVNKMGNEIIPIFETLASEKNIDFTIDVDKIINENVKLDRLRMNQVLINVVSNAIKYTDNGGKVKLTVRQEKSKRKGFGKYVFIVEDNGIGMSKEFQSHLFETFSRELTSSVSKREGTGLGLSIVKRLVDMMGGTISVESEQGVGTTFTITMDFEIVKEVKITEAKPKKQKKIENLKGKRILLVDDNDFNREIACENLQDQGVFVEEATNGIDAIEKVHLAGGKYFDCVLMDVQMPIMNGYEATKAIRNFGTEFARLPIIALSANAFEEDIKLSKEAGMNAHLSKPIRVNELLDTLNKFI